MKNKLNGLSHRNICFQTKSSDTYVICNDDHGEYRFFLLKNIKKDNETPVNITSRFNSDIENLAINQSKNDTTHL
jgi:hypothetical protein